MNPINRVIIVPGNGCTPVNSCNWYLWLKEKIDSSENLQQKNIQVILEDMPDPYDAHETVWVPFIINELGADRNSIVVGHSSGAEATMRLLETNRLGGAILVSACHSDLGLESERISGYYSRPWQWEKIRENAEFIVQYHSTDDPFIPISEARHVSENLCSEYYEFTNKSHFFEPFSEIMQLLEEKILHSHGDVRES